MNQNLVVWKLVTVRAALLIGGLLSTVGLSPVQADQGGIPAQVAALQKDVQLLQQQVGRLVDHAKAQHTAITQLTAVVNSQSALIIQLQQQNQALQATLGCMSKTGDDVYFTACNVHIVSGSGATDGALNGRGNLIVGYNEDAAVLPGNNPPSLRSGSHNLVVGAGHSYSSYGGLVAGYVNSITNTYASVSGGTGNTASGLWSSVSGGSGNTAAVFWSSVSGGFGNVSNGVGSSISGGAGNSAKGYYSSISGGAGNSAGGHYSSVSGGTGNGAGGAGSSVSGGAYNRAGGSEPVGVYSSISGGINNIAEGTYSSISGGNGVTLNVDRGWATGALTSP